MMRATRTPPHSGEPVERPAGGLTPPYAILKDAIKAVPSLKYALGVLGIVAAISIVSALRVDYRVAALGTIVTLALMVMLVLFAKLTRAAPKQFVAPVAVVMWAFLLLTIGTACLLITSVFFKVPVDLQEWIKPATRAPSGGAVPAGDVSGVLAGAGPPPPGGPRTSPELGVDIVVRRQGTQAFVVLPDGAPLTSEVDDYYVVTRTTTSGYLYVFQQDAEGHLQWLFPANETSPYSSGKNPVPADSTVAVPDGSRRALYLDSTIGTESIYAAFSETRWPDLEGALRSAVALPAQAAGKRRQVLSGNRGVGGIRRVPASDSVTRVDDRGPALPKPVDLFRASGHFVVVKRWFTHVGAH